MANSNSVRVFDKYTGTEMDVRSFVSCCVVRRRREVERERQRGRGGEGEAERERRRGRGAEEEGGRRERELIPSLHCPLNFSTRT
jgi:hypothetical protein